MTGTATWTTTPIPAYLLEAGDRIHYGTTVTLAAVHDDGHLVALRWAGGGTDVFRRADFQVHVPDVPVDGYNLWKPTTSPLGCTCLSRRGDDRNWHIVATDDGCRCHGIHDLYDD